MNRSSHHPIARTALASDRTSLTVRPAGSIPVAHLHVPLFFPLITQYFSLRTSITVAGLIVDKLRAVILRTHPTPFIGTLPLARFIHAGPDELNTPLLHRHYIVPADKPTIGDRLLRSLAQILFHPLDPRLQLFKVIARLHHSHRHHHPVSGIRVDLHVVARRKTTPSCFITRASGSLVDTRRSCLSLPRPSSPSLLNSSSACSNRSWRSQAARWRALVMRWLVSSSLSAPTTSTCSRACLSACSTRSFLPKLSAAALARILVPSCITRCKLINPSALKTPKLCTNNSSSAASCLTRKSVNVCALTTRAPVSH